MYGKQLEMEEALAEDWARESALQSPHIAEALVAAWRKDSTKDAERWRKWLDGADEKARAVYLKKWFDATPETIEAVAAGIPATVYCSLPPSGKPR